MHSTPRARTWSYRSPPWELWSAPRCIFKYLNVHTHSVQKGSQRQAPGSGPRTPSSFGPHPQAGLCSEEVSSCLPTGCSRYTARAGGLRLGTGHMGTWAQAPHRSFLEFHEDTGPPLTVASQNLRVTPFLPRTDRTPPLVSCAQRGSLGLFYSLSLAPW